MEGGCWHWCSCCRPRPSPQRSFARCAPLLALSVPLHSRSVYNMEECVQQLSQTGSGTTASARLRRARGGAKKRVHSGGAAAGRAASSRVRPAVHAMCKTPQVAESSRRGLRARSLPGTVAAASDTTHTGVAREVA